MKYKACAATVKTFDDGSTFDQDGVFEAIVSVFGNVDSYGDVVMAGAFTDTLAAWKSSGNPIPVYWSHRMDDPSFNVGEVLDAAEVAGGDARIPKDAPQSVKDNGGLWVRGKLDTGPDASVAALATRRLLMARRVTQFSFAYDELDSGPVKVDGRDAWALRKLALYEVSPTPIGANQDTVLVGAKSARKAAPTMTETLTQSCLTCDAALDDALTLFASVDTTDSPPAIVAGIAAVLAADAAMDALMAALGVPDVPEPGEDDAAKSRRVPTGNGALDAVGVKTEDRATGNVEEPSPYVSTVRLRRDIALAYLNL